MHLTWLLTAPVSCGDSYVDMSINVKTSLEGHSAYTPHSVPMVITSEHRGGGQEGGRRELGHGDLLRSKSGALGSTGCKGFCQWPTGPARGLLRVQLDPNPGCARVAHLIPAAGPPGRLSLSFSSVRWVSMPPCSEDCVGQCSLLQFTLGVA